MKKRSVFAVGLLVPGALVLSGTFVDSAEAEPVLYRVVCEPTEVSDMKQTIRRTINDQLSQDERITNKNIKVSVKPIKKVEVKALEQLASGINIGTNAATFNTAVTGVLAGHACVLDAEVNVQVRGVYVKTGLPFESEIVSSRVTIPGSFAVKNRVAKEKAIR